MNSNSTIQEMSQIESGIFTGRNFGSIEKSGIPREESPALPETLSIEGNPRTGGGWKILASVFFVCLGCWVLYGVVTSTGKADDTTGLVCLLAAISILIGFAIPCNAHTYLDLTRRELIRETHYAGFEVSRRRLPFAGFQAIVVRHLVHEAEGETSYTGSVGLKPRHGGAVLWLKNFQTTADEIPAAAYAYAREMNRLTGIPLPLPFERPRIPAPRASHQVQMSRRGRLAPRIRQPGPLQTG